MYDKQHAYYLAHADEQRQRCRDRYHRLKAEHRCVQCAQELSESETHLICETCRQKAKERRRGRQRPQKRKEVK